MNPRLLTSGILAILVTNIANATVYFDTINPPAGPAIGFDGPQSDGVPVLASSFHVPGTPDFSQISLKLAADNPTDGGSFTLFLVPDNGSGGSAGVAGAPLYSGGTTFSSYTNAISLGTVGDSYLAPAASGSTLLTLNVSYATDAAIAAQTQNGEYWIGLVPSANSSVDWFFNAADAGAGTANQAYFNNVGGLQTSPDSTGAYQVLVDTPEPGTLAVLASALILISRFRRRSANNT